MDKIISRFFNSEKKLFYLFLIIHLVVWTSVGLIRTVLPTDSLEGIYWGALHDFGTPKHPPLAGWLTYLAYLPFQKDISIYLLSQLFILCGFVYIYKLAKCFLNETQSMLSVIMLEGCWVYSYITGYYGFNPDVILLLMLPMLTYYFYQCMEKCRPIDWVKLGVLVGIAFLNKYQTGLLILSMFIYACMFKRETFKNKFFYLSIVIAFLIFLPHLLWLIRYDFFPFLYFENELTDTSLWNHISAPFMFVCLQLALIAGTLLIYFLLKFRLKSPFRLLETYNKKDLWFMILFGLLPILSHVLMGIVEGGTVRPRWGYEFWFMTGMMLFYFFPCKVNKEGFVFVFKSALVVMLVIFLGLGGLLSIEKNYRSRYPVSTVFEDLENFWAEKYDTPLKYFGGYIEWTLPLTIYGKTHPSIILDTFGYKSPWIDEDDLKKSGIMILGRNPEIVVTDTRKACPYLPDDFSIKPVGYRFFVHNAFKMPREYKIYYFIVPPMK